MPSDLPRLVTRVTDDINDKFLIICEIEERTTSNLLALIIKKYIQEYEQLNGEIIIKPKE
jgi:hypothetical protein